MGRQSFSIDAANEFDPLFEDVYDWCEIQGLDLDTLIHEDGPAQMEINFRHGEALHLADQITVFKRTMREAALKHDVAATFMAKPITDQPGSAMHIHQSVVDIKTGKNLFSNPDGSMSELFMLHIGGLQKYIPELLPLFAPNVNSFRRFLPDTSAPVNVEWGEEEPHRGPARTGSHAAEPPRGKPSGRCRRQPLSVCWRLRCCVATWAWSATSSQARRSKAVLMSAVTCVCRSPSSTLWNAWKPVRMQRSSWVKNSCAATSR